MEQVVINEVKRSLFHKLPKWLQVVLLTLSIITVVYWLGFVVYKLLCAIRCIGAFIFEKRNYWTFLVCILILLIGTFIVAQFILGLDPWGHFSNWVVDRFNELKGFIIEAIT